jgi:hypothetical protein
VKPAKSLTPLRTNPLVLCSLLSAFYLVLVSLLPANRLSMQQYGWTSFDYHMIYLMIVIPMVAIWFAGFYGYYCLQRYANSISGSPDADDYRQLSRGVAWLAWGLPIQSLSAVLLNGIANSYTGFHSWSIIISNYISLIIPLVAFTIIGNSSRNLITRANIRISLGGARSIVLAFVTLGVLFCYLSFRHFDLASLNGTNNPYYLAMWFMLLTIIIPYLYAWFVGLLAAYEIASLATHVRGVLYNQALRLLGSGLVAVIVSSILLQYIGSVAPRTGHLELNSRLFVIYIIRLLAGAGRRRT